MIGILLITHGNFGHCLIENVTHVLNTRPPNLQALGMMKSGPEALIKQARDLLKQVDQGKGVVLLTDIYGSSPSNLACELLQTNYIEGLSGVNLPMLLRVITYRELSLPEVVSKARSGAHDGIVDLISRYC